MFRGRHHRSADEQAAVILTHLEVRRPRQAFEHIALWRFAGGLFEHVWSGRRFAASQRRSALGDQFFYRHHHMRIIARPASAGPR